MDFFCELRQEFLEFIVMHKTEMPRVNVVKDFLSKGIKLHNIF